MLGLLIKTRKYSLPSLKIVYQPTENLNHFLELVFLFLEGVGLPGEVVISTDGGMV